MKPVFYLAAIWLLGNLVPAAIADENTTKPPLPAPAAHKIDFHREILPILARRCAKCHASGKSEGELRIDTRDSLLAGGDSGEAVVVGKSAESLLIQLVAGTDPDRVMPAKGPWLSAKEVGLLRAWIDQGLPWEKGLGFSSAKARTSLAVRRPTLPEADAKTESANPIDRLLGPYFQQHGVQPGKAISDRVFARRVYADLIGLRPTPEEITALQQDSRPNRRELLVRRLLANRKAYADHWLTFWNDSLRNDYRGTGFIDDGRRQITEWLYRALYENKSYDRFVHELISPVPGSEGFILGIKWRGVVNASQRREMQAAQTVSQVFMGTNLKCASCHDSFVNHWKLADAYALASVFAEKPLEIHRCNQSVGQVAAPAFLYAQLGVIEPNASLTRRMEQLADLMTSPKNGRLIRTIVNRQWAWFFGRALIEPVNDLDQPPLDADLLDWLASDLLDHGCDLKHTMMLICSSRAYQSESVDVAKPKAPSFVFRGPLVRHMTAEQFVDAVSQLTGVWQTITPSMKKADGRKQGGQLSAISRASARPSGSPGPVRAALADANPLTRALGRPNREQVVVDRDNVATTLQALELTNGTTLDHMLKQGAQNWLKRPFSSRDELIRKLYQAALGRDPNHKELNIAQSLLGSPPQAEGVHDLLWALTMLPEFQLIQ